MKSDAQTLTNKLSLMISKQQKQSARNKINPNDLVY